MRTDPLTPLRGLALHLLRRHVFDVRRERPAVAERVFQNGDAVAVELVGQRPLHGGTRRLRALHEGIDIRDVDQQVDRRAAQRLRAAEVHLGELVGQHDRRGADADLGVTDAAAGCVKRIVSVAPKALA